MSRPQSEKGMVLLLVVMVVALLAALLTEFAFSSLVDLRLAETFRDTSRAYYLGAGGVKVGQMLLQDDKNNYDAPDEMWAQGIYGYPVADGTVSIQIEDLGGRIDLNRLYIPAQRGPDPVVMDRLERLFIELGLDDPDGLLDALIDWLDEDDQARQFGAESAYYLDRPRPYPAKNGPLDTLDELLLIKGFDTDILNQLRPNVTVHGGEKINVNTASEEVLLALAEEMDMDAVQTIVDARQDRPFTKVEEIKDLPGMGNIYGFFNSYLTVTSPTYHITARGDVGDGSRTVQAVVEKASGKIFYQRVN